MPDATRTGEKPAIDLIHHIISTHHEFLRTEAPKLRRMIGELPDTLEARRCQQNLEVLLSDIDQHLLKEERILFPTIEEIEMSVIEGREARIMACGVTGPINQMVYEHEQVKELLRALDQDCPKIGREDLTLAVAALKDDLLEHIRVEEEELFPLAEELCPGIVV
jgi:regulator of cell morphogenesis and NO signaling